MLGHVRGVAGVRAPSIQVHDSRTQLVLHIAVLCMIAQVVARAALAVAHLRSPSLLLLRDVTNFLSRAEHLRLPKGVEFSLQGLRQCICGAHAIDPRCHHRPCIPILIHMVAQGLTGKCAKVLVLEGTVWISGGVVPRRESGGSTTSQVSKAKQH